LRNISCSNAVAITAVIVLSPNAVFIVIDISAWFAIARIDIADEFEPPDQGRRESIAHFRRCWRALFGCTVFA
jgi:hypothetical protein